MSNRGSQNEATGRRRVILPLVVLLLHLSSGEALAATAPRMATVEVVERGDKGPRTALRLILALADEGPSKVDAVTGKSSYRVRVSCDRVKGDGVLVRLDLSREERRDKGHLNIHLSLGGRVVIGERVVLGHLASGDGEDLEVAVTIR